MLDAHCHLDRYSDPRAVAEEASRHGLFIVAVTNLPSHFKIGCPHVATLNGVRLSLGLHPLSARQHNAERQEFVRLFHTTSFIGEVGLDFSREGKDTASIQLESFRLIAKLLAASSKCVTLHSRGAESETLAIIKEHRLKPAVFHWYSGPVKLIDDILDDGHYFSVNPAMIQSDKGQKIIARLPHNRVLTETDGPYVKSQGKPVQPWAVRAVEEFLSGRWQVSPTQASQTIWTNFRRLLSELGLLTTL